MTVIRHVQVDAPSGGSFGELLSWAGAELRGRIGTPRLDAELLLAAAAGCARSTVIAFPERRLPAPATTRFLHWVRRRADGEPLAYLTGEREFYGLRLRVTPEVLVPRPETELLVDEALRRIDAAGARSVLDLGTGTGAIALAIKAQRPDLRLTAVDSSAAAVRVAKENAARLGLDVEFVESSWFEALGGRRFDVIACNPPYVSSDDAHFDGPLRHEPRAALDGGADGIAAFRSILSRACAHLADGACLIVEHGCDQRPALIELAAAHGLEIAAARRDFGGLPRLLVLRRR